MDIPREKLTIRFARSGGPGGQNVNKVETKVEVRFLLDEADWISPRIRGRLRQMARRRMNSEGELVIRSSRFRSQARNLEDCIAKLSALLEAARQVPKRRIATRPTKASRQRRMDSKKARSKTKAQRRWRPGKG
jgi:ribosome-associated protein